MEEPCGTGSPVLGQSDQVQQACLKLLEYRNVLLSGRILSRSSVKLTCFFTTPLYCSMAASYTPVTERDLPMPGVEYCQSEKLCVADVPDQASRHKCVIGTFQGQSVQTRLMCLEHTWIVPGISKSPNTGLPSASSLV